MKTVEDLDLTPTQALGVALSVQCGSMVMGECQNRAPDMLDHLQRMGFDVVRSAVGIFPGAEDPDLSGTEYEPGPFRG